MLNDFVI